MNLVRPRVSTWFLVAAVFGGFWLCSLREREEAYEASLAHRLLGPASEVAAAWQWVRVRSAMDDARMDTAYARAEFALDLAPRSTDGWSFLASKLAFDRASPYQQKNPELRTRWTQAALDLLLRGQEVAEHPEQLALTRGLVLVNVGDSEGAIPWEGGQAGAWQAAQLAFEEASDLDPGATEAWAQRAANLCLRLAAPQLEPDVEARLAALGAAFELLDEGARVVRDAGPLHFQKGLFAGFVGESADGAHWPGGRQELFKLAVSAFQRAQDLEFPLAKVAKEEAQEALDEALSIEPSKLPE